MKFWRKFFFTIWYWRDPPWDSGVSPPELLTFIEKNPPGRALDLGCGTGTNVVRLAQAGWEAAGVDFVSRAIRTARRKAGAAGIKAEFHVGDVTKLTGLAGPYDLILDMGCFHGIGRENFQAYAANIDRLLAPGGTFLLYVFYREKDSEKAGIVEPELAVFSPTLEIYHREDGTNLGRRASSWLWLRRP